MASSIKIDIIADNDLLKRATFETIRFMRRVAVEIGKSIAIDAVNAFKILGKTILATGSLIKGLIPNVVPAIGDLVSLLGTAAKGFVGIGKVGVSAFTSIASAATSFVTAYLSQTDNLKAATDAVKLERIQKRFEELSIAIGERLFPIIEKFLPVVSTVVSALEVLLEKTNFLDDDLNKLADSGLANLVKGFQWFAETVVGAVTVVQTIFENWRTSASILFDSILLKVLQISLDMKHFFTDTLPKVASFFIDFLSALLGDIVDMWNDSFKVIIENLKNFWKAVIDTLQGRAANFRFKGLEDAFERTMTVELPKFAARGTTLLETTIAKSIADLSGELGESFANNLRDNMKMFEMFQNEVVAREKKVTDDIRKEREERFRIEQDFQGFGQQVTEEGQLMLDRMARARRRRGGGGVAAIRAAQSVGDFEGLQDLNRRISSAAASPAQRLIDEQKKQVAAQEKANAELVKINQNTLIANQQFNDIKDKLGPLR